MWRVIGIRQGAVAPGGRGAHAPVADGLDHEQLLPWFEIARWPIDLRAIGAGLRRQRRAMAAIVAAGMFLGLAVFLLMPRIYEARASVKIDGPSAAVPGADRFLQTQVDLLHSRSLARRVADGLSLAADDAFLKAMGRSPPVTNAPAQRMEAVLDALQKNLRIDAPRNSRVVAIYFRSRDAAVAARVANRYSDEFVAGNAGGGIAIDGNARQFLQNGLAAAWDRLVSAQRVLIAYGRAAGLVDGATRAEARRAAEQPGSPGVASDFAFLDESLVDAQAARLRIEPQVRAAGARAPGELREQYLDARVHEEALARARGLLKEAAPSVKDREMVYGLLKRELDADSQAYGGLLRSYSASGGATDAVSDAAGSVTPVDMAGIPRDAASPGIWQILALALLGGVATAAAYAFVRENLDDTFHAPREVEAGLRMPLLGVVPRVADGELLEVMAEAKSELAEAYGTIRASLCPLFDRRELPSLLVTGSRPGEGASTSALALARQFASLGQRVLLVDADLRCPSLHQMLGIAAAQKGLATVLERSCCAADAIMPTAFDRVAFLPSGPVPPDPANLLTRMRLRELLGELAVSHDIVILDGPPLLGLADAVEIAAAAAGTLFVVEAARTRLEEARLASGRLARGGGRVLGAILAKSRSHEAFHEYF